MVKRLSFGGYLGLPGSKKIRRKGPGRGGRLLKSKTVRLPVKPA